MFQNYQLVQALPLYATPNIISRLVVSHLKIKKDEKVYDPACGVGTIFRDIINSMHDLHYNINNLYGNEINSNAYEIAKSEIGSDNIKKINSLNNVLSYTNKFDVVVSDIPYEIKMKGKKITTLFTEHMLDSLKESGRGCIIGSKKLVSEFKQILGDKIEFISDWGRINNFEYVAIYFRKNKRFEIEI
jgi:type I restriction-modification system DNA methylase subunit